MQTTRLSVAHLPSHPFLGRRLTARRQQLTRRLQHPRGIECGPSRAVHPLPLICHHSAASVGTDTKANGDAKPIPCLEPSACVCGPDERPIALVSVGPFGGNNSITGPIPAGRWPGLPPERWGQRAYNGLSTYTQTQQTQNQDLKLVRNPLHSSGVI